MCNSFLFSLRDIHFMTSTNKITYRAASAVQKQDEKIDIFPRARWGSYLSHNCLRCPVHRCPLVGRMDTSESVLRLYRTHRKCLLRTHLTKPSPPTCCQCEVLIQWHAPSAVLVCLEKVLKTFEGPFRFVWLMSGRAQWKRSKLKIAISTTRLLTTSQLSPVFKTVLKPWMDYFPFAIIMAKREVHSNKEEW